jgi:hypothetical protein
MNQVDRFQALIRHPDYFNLHLVKLSITCTLEIAFKNQDNIFCFIWK